MTHLKSSHLKLTIFINLEKILEGLLKILQKIQKLPEGTGDLLHELLLQSFCFHFAVVEARAGGKNQLCTCKNGHVPIKRKSRSPKLHMQPPISARAVLGCMCSNIARMRVLRVFERASFTAQVVAARAKPCICCCSFSCFYSR